MGIFLSYHNIDILPCPKSKIAFDVKYPCLNFCLDLKEYIYFCINLGGVNDDNEEPSDY
jgi:hypothetical protein